MRALEAPTTLSARMAQQAQRLNDWALSDQGIQCYLLELMDGYARKLAYRPSEQSVFATALKEARKGEEEGFAGGPDTRKVSKDTVFVKSNWKIRASQSDAPGFTSLGSLRDISIRGQRTTGIASSPLPPSYSSARIIRRNKKLYVLETYKLQHNPHNPSDKNPLPLTALKQLKQQCAAFREAKPVSSSVL